MHSGDKTFMESCQCAFLFLKTAKSAAGVYVIVFFLVVLGESWEEYFLKASLNPTYWIWLRCLHWIDYVYLVL